MKTITLTATEYIEFCAYYNNLPVAESINTTYAKNKVFITASEEFLTKLGY